MGGTRLNGNGAGKVRVANVTGKGDESGVWQRCKFFSGSGREEKDNNGRE